MRVHERLRSETAAKTAWAGILKFTTVFPSMARVQGGLEVHQLHCDGEPLQFVDVSGEEIGTIAVPAGSFTALGIFLYVKPPAGKNGMDCHLEYSSLLPMVSRGRVTSSSGAWNGFCLVPGDRVRFDGTVLAAGGELLLTTGVAAPMGPDQQLAFRLLAGDAPVWEHRPRVGPELETVFHRIRVPDCPSGELCLTVEGGPGVGLILDPMAIPERSLPLPAHRERPRPDIVLFLADTLRADALEPWGGDWDIAPNINAFLAESACFVRAWTPASWTLPAHASMFSGLYPYQHGVTYDRRSLPVECVTVAELLSAGGYRTAAVTESSYVSARYGLDQGFEAFEEGPIGRLDVTLERVRRALERDDGRPLFLFVQTYRAHTPYRVSPQTVVRLKRVFGSDPAPQHLDFENLNNRAVAGDDKEGDERSAACRLLEQLYLGGVADLDRGFGELIRILDEIDLHKPTVIFASDHGEAFAEHGLLRHGNSVFEEVSRIPIGIRGAGLDAGRRPLGASLLDLSPTICDIAGIAPDLRWEGSSLLSLVEDRPIYSFSCSPPPDPPWANYALMEGPWKLLGRMPLTGETFDVPDRLYDLRRDPGEQMPSVPGPVRFRKHETRMRALLRPQVAVEELHLTAAEKAALRALGYADSPEK
ncbi:MAG: sulfatase [Planctomycetota bacterium]